jgi:hypothetical protein
MRWSKLILAVMCLLAVAALDAGARGYPLIALGLLVPVWVLAARLCKYVACQDPDALMFDQDELFW